MTQTLVLEIGCEELPTSFVRAALEQLPVLLAEEFAKYRIEHGDLRALGTPRRLALLAHNVNPAIAQRTEEVIGPAESVARDSHGAWTKAAEGFAKKNQINLADATIVETPKGRYLRAERSLEAGVTQAFLPAILSNVCARLSFTKAMRWGTVETAFGRPVQWLLGLYGTQQIAFEFVGRTSGRTTLGHRFLSPAAIECKSADDYVALLRSADVLVDVDEREALQHSLLTAAAQAQNGTLVRNAALEAEVLGLVEKPAVITGHFDPAFLALPEELIETVMDHHQRYFAVRGADQKLLPVFLTTVNTALNPEKIRLGNERVLRARLSDARFFVDKDRSEPLANRSAKLQGIVYHKALGTYADKVARVVKLSAHLAPMIGADPALATQAASLCKCDLVSLTVGEFPELQGYVGRDLARHEGLDTTVANAIAEHYQPRGAEDATPSSAVGRAVAIADRLDTLCGFFAIGETPSGAGDAFGLRRAALGIIRTLTAQKNRVALAPLLTFGLALYTQERFAKLDRAQVVSKLVQFFRERLEVTLTQRFRVDLVRACLAVSTDCDPFDISERAEALHHLRDQPSLATAAKCIERATNISREVFAQESRESLLAFVRTFAYELADEKLLRDIVVETDAKVTAAMASYDYATVVAAIANNLADPLEGFFTRVFVMDEDAVKRDARLRLLKLVTLMSSELCRFDMLVAAPTKS
jgi:glycyl-tRNA synthetase beta chain